MTDFFMQRQHGFTGGAARPSNNALINGFVSYMRTVRKKPSTIYNYQRRYAAYVSFLEGKSLLDATFDDINDFLARPREKIRGRESGALNGQGRTDGAPIAV